MTADPQHKSLSPADLLGVGALLAIAVAGWFYVHGPFLYNGHFYRNSREGMIKAASGNMRQIANAAQGYMMEKGVTVAHYTDLVGPATDNYLHMLTPVADEDYTRLVFISGQSEAHVTSSVLGNITYNM